MLPVASLGALLAFPALAQDSGDTYGGIGLGRTQMDLHPDRMAHALNPAIDGQPLSSDESDIGLKLFLGYQFSPRFGVEAGYYRLGESSFRAQNSMPPGQLNGSLRGLGLSLDLVGNWPVMEHLSVIGRFGAAATRSEAYFNGSGSAATAISSLRESRVDAKVGFGLQYALSPRLILRGEVERYRIGDTLGGRVPVVMSSLSLVMPLEHEQSTTRPASSEPTYVTPVPPAAPPAAKPAAPAVELIVASPPPPIQAARPLPALLKPVSVSATALFATDQSSLSPVARVMLENFCVDISGLHFERIELTGSADRLGSATHNRKLIKQRTNEVKAYLVQACGLDAHKLVTASSARASSKHVPAKIAAAECKRAMPLRKLRSCLQPDRSVEVFVTGRR
jgi:OOP family OmpA-OmpF porin